MILIFEHFTPFMLWKKKIFFQVYCKIPVYISYHVLQGIVPFYKGQAQLFECRGEKSSERNTAWKNSERKNLPALQYGADSALRSRGNRKEESFPRMQRRLQCLFQPTESLPSTRVLEKGQSSCKKHWLGLISFRLLSSSISDITSLMS